MIQRMAFAEGRTQATAFCHPDPFHIQRSSFSRWSGQRGEPQGVPAGERGLLGTLDPWEEEEVEPSYGSLHRPQNTQPLLQENTQTIAKPQLFFNHLGLQLSPPHPLPPSHSEQQLRVVQEHQLGQAGLPRCHPGGLYPKTCERSQHENAASRRGRVSTPGAAAAMGRSQCQEPSGAQTRVR